MWGLFMYKQADFLAHYHPRSNVESTLSAVKRTFRRHDVPSALATSSSGPARIRHHPQGRASPIRALFWMACSLL
jgi:hypothetical protein